MGLEAELAVRPHTRYSLLGAVLEGSWFPPRWERTETLQGLLIYFGRGEAVLGAWPRGEVPECHGSLPPVAQLFLSLC
jgi:hypothetical protein